MDRRTITACVCTRRRDDELRRTLGSLAESTRPFDQVVVSDDAGQPSTERLCADTPLDVDYTVGPARGLSANRNHALGLAMGDLCVFLDDDCSVAPDFVAHTFATMIAAERIRGVGRVVVTGTERLLATVIHAHDGDFLGFQHKPYGPGSPMRSVVINATLWPTDIVRRLRFDERLLYGYEEIDMARRVVTVGCAIVECPAAINHHRRSPASRDGYDAAEEVSRLYTTFKDYAWLSRRPVRALAFAIVAPLHHLLSAIRHDGPSALPGAAARIRQAVTLTAREAIHRSFSRKPAATSEHVDD